MSENKSVIDGGMTDALEEIIKIQNQEDCLAAVVAGKPFDYKALQQGENNEDGKMMQIKTTSYLARYVNKPTKIWREKY